MKINVHIERIVIDGLPVDRHTGPVIRRAIQRELTRLLTEDSSAHLPTSSAAEAVRTAPITIGLQAKPHTIGKSIARAIHGGMTQ